MAANVFFWCVTMFLVGPAAGYHCPQDCDSEGLLPEEVPTTFFPVEQVSQCAEPPSDREVLREALHCDNSSTGTGHLLYRELTGDVIAVERCYSFCFGSLTPPEGTKPDAEDLDDSGKKCFQLANSFVCFSACLFMRRLDGLKTAPSLYNLAANATCKDFCTPPDGICDRAFSPRADVMCGMNCKTSLCTDMCDTLDQRFQNQSNPQAQSISSPSGKLSLKLASSYELRKQGVLEVSSTDNNGSIATYGLVWKVTVNDSLEYYIPQHLPFHFLQTEVGPLYRVGSNMLSIRQLQCLPGVNLSYALVNAVGRSEFSEPQEQCFYGNGFPQPPTDLHVSIGFIPFSPKLRLTLEAGTLSPDHAHVTGYEVAVYRENSVPIVKLVFPDKENLSLIFEDEEFYNVFPSFSEPYYLSFYALPQKNTTANNRTIRPAGNWLMMTPEIPDYPILNGTSCYSLTQDRSEGKVNATFHLSLHSGWKSLAPVKSIQGRLTLRGPVTKTLFPGFPPIVTIQPLGHPYLETHTIENVTQAEYTYKYDNLDPTSGEEFYDFTITLNSSFADPGPLRPALETSTDFTAQALPPLPVTELQVCYTMDSGSQALLNISWLPPRGRRVDLTFQVNSSRDGATPSTIAVTPPDPLLVNLTVPLPANSVHITVVALSSGVAGTPSTVTLNLTNIASNTCLKAEGTSVSDNDIISVVSTCPTEEPQGPTEMPQGPNSARRCTLSAAAILCAVILFQMLAEV